MLKFGLLMDGTSDQVLAYPLRWLAHQLGIIGQIEPILGEASRGMPLKARLAAALAQHPWDALLVHRDAEKDPWPERNQEIERASLGLDRRVIPVIPVRMTEAWFLIEERAIRIAAGNPHGRVRLNIPDLRSLESLADPKKTLLELLETATEQRGRRLAGLRPHSLLHRVGDLIKDYSPLRVLPAFQELERELVAYRDDELREAGHGDSRR